MEDKNIRLRGIDFYCGIAIMLFGAFVLYEGFGMPLKDSWGGVSNVWYVSPALSPIFVGAGMILLGALLCSIGLREAGSAEIRHVLRSALNPDTLLSMPAQRFLAAAAIPAVFIYILIPRVDFCIASVLFLWSYMMLFYLVDVEGFKKLRATFALGSGLLCVAVPLITSMRSDAAQTGVDLLTLACTVVFVLRARQVVRDHGSGAAFGRVLALCIAASLILAICFRFFLLVPLPTEGIIVEFMDRVRYNEF